MSFRAITCAEYGTEMVVTTKKERERRRKKKKKKHDIYDDVSGAEVLMSLSVSNCLGSPKWEAVLHVMSIDNKSCA
jgi:hypothetical protein